MLSVSQKRRPIKPSPYLIFLLGTQSSWGIICWITATLNIIRLLVWSLICWTRFATNTLNRQASLLIYPKTTLLSFQNISSSTWMSSSSFSSSEILTDSVAAVSSSLGIETNVKGAILDFPISNARFSYQQGAMYLTTLIKQSDIARLTISHFTCIWERV